MHRTRHVYLTVSASIGKATACHLVCLYLVTKRALVADDFAVHTIADDSALSLEGQVLLPLQGGEAPLVGEHDLLPARELILSTAESLDDVRLGVILGADGEEDLSNVHAGYKTEGLAEGATHTGLEPMRRRRRFVSSIRNYEFDGMNLEN
jgi:hypothetical protein